MYSRERSSRQSRFPRCFSRRRVESPYKSRWEGRVEREREGEEGSEMKGGKVELRDSHKSVDGVPSHCSLVWDGHGERIVTAGPDSTVIIRPYPLSSSSSLTLRQHNSAVTALAVSPNSTSLASASRSVKLFTFPGAAPSSDNALHFFPRF